MFIMQEGSGSFKIKYYFGKKIKNKNPKSFCPNATTRLQFW